MQQLSLKLFSYFPLPLYLNSLNYLTTRNKFHMPWLYITGRGHSGSTFLDIVLGNSQSIESYGEVISAIDRLSHNCGCGKIMRECPFWASVIESYQSSNREWLTDVRLLKSRSHVRYWVPLLLQGGYGQRTPALEKINNGIYDAIQDIAQVDWVLDSSKEPTRALFLLSSNPQAKVIHILRNPLDVVSSYKKRFEKFGYFKFLRRTYTNKKYFLLFAAITGMSWSVGNLMIEMMKMKYPKRIFRFKHEGILTDFDQSTRDMEGFLGVNLSDIRALHRNKEGFIVGHNIGGNHIRNDARIFLKTTSEPRNLSRAERLLVLFTTWPLRMVYNYH